LDGIGGWCLPELDQVALSVVADAGFEIVGVAVQAHADPAVIRRRQGHLQGGAVLGPGVGDVSGIQGGEMDAGVLGQQADLFRWFPAAVRFGGRLRFVDLEGELQRSVLGGGQDDGTGGSGGPAAPAAGHLFGVVVVLGETDEVSALTEVESELGFVDQHGDS
jgi:hypothetical protein